MHLELELAYEIVIIDSNDGEKDNDICSIFKGDEANNVLEGTTSFIFRTNLIYLLHENIFIKIFY